MTSNIDSAIRLQLAEVVEALTTSGKAELDQNILKKLKNLCKSSDNHVRHVYHLLMHQLEKEHAEIRYSTLLICDELFRRSHHFRELLVSDFQTFLELTLEIDPEQQLPPPLQVAKKLKYKALECIRHWYDAYGEGYQKLKLGYLFLQDCKKIDFIDIQAPGIIEQRRQEERQSRQEIVNNEKLQKCLVEMKELIPEIQTCLKQVEECCKLVLPQELFSDIDFENPKPCCSKDLINQDDYQRDTKLNAITSEIPEVEKAEGEDWMRQHGLGNKGYNLIVEVRPEKLKISASADNTVILSTLQENFKLIKNKYSLYIGKWIKTIVKSCGPANELKKVIDLKTTVAETLKKGETLGIADIKLKTDDSEDEDEFEEVETKEGYEPVIPQHLRKEYGLQLLNSHCDQVTKVTPKEWKPNHNDRAVDELQDPTSAACTLKHFEAKMNNNDLSNLIKQKNVTTGLGSDGCAIPEEKAKAVSNAPKLRYDTDLINWGEKREITPSIMKFDSLHRFWQPVDNETQEIFKPKEETAALNSRVIEFSGKFTPVKWECRSLLPSGKLCPRRDRFKCPLHGPVIPRDNCGNPSRLEDRLRLQKEQEEHQQANPEWQDPGLLEDIKAATGIDLTIKKKQKKDTKKKQKFPGLTDLNAKQSTARKRLEKKVFDKGAIKRVAQTLDNLDYKKFKDKFGNQFNYSCET